MRAQHEASTGLLPLVTELLGIGDTAVVVDRDVQALDTSAAVTIASAFSMDPPATTLRYVCHLLGVDVHEVTGFVYSQ